MCHKKRTMVELRVVLESKTWLQVELREVLEKVACLKTQLSSCSIKESERTHFDKQKDELVVTDFR